MYLREGFAEIRQRICFEVLLGSGWVRALLPDGNDIGNTSLFSNPPQSSRQESKTSDPKTAVVIPSTAFLELCF